MAELRDRIYLRRSQELSKRPELLDIDNGELALNYNAGDPGLYFKDISSDGTRRIRKIGPIHYGPLPPNNDASESGYYSVLSDGECWIDTSLGESNYSFKVWDGDSSEWLEISSQTSASKDQSLDQFRDWADGDNFIHTEGINLKINNKVALAGQSTASGNKLFINAGNNFATSVELSGSYVFKTDGNSASVSQISIKTTEISAASFVPVAIESFPLSYRSAKYTVQIEVNKPSPKTYQVREVLAIHDGTGAFLTEYGVLDTASQYLGELDLTINNVSQEVVLTFEKDSSISFPLKIKVLRTSLLV
jgi:hypothetical protein